MSTPTGMCVRTFFYRWYFMHYVYVGHAQHATARACAQYFHSVLANFNMRWGDLRFGSLKVCGLVNLNVAPVFVDKWIFFFAVAFVCASSFFAKAAGVRDAVLWFFSIGKWILLTAVLLPISVVPPGWRRCARDFAGDSLVPCGCWTWDVQPVAVMIAYSSVSNSSL